MAKLLTESNFEVNIDKDSKKNIYIEGIFAGCEQKNRNGRIYPREILEGQVEQILEMVNSKCCLGELNHPENRSEISLSEASHMIEKLEWKGDELYGRAKVLQNTPKGWTLKGLLEDGVRLGISSRGLGETKFDESRDAEVVTDSFRLLTWDVVQNPSHRTAWVNGIYEGKEFPLPNEVKNPTDEQVKMAKEAHEKKIWQVIENFSKIIL